MALYAGTHWASTKSNTGQTGPRLKGYAKDPDPSPIGHAALDACGARDRVMRPAVRRSRVEKVHARRRRSAHPSLSSKWAWDEVLDLAVARRKAHRRIWHSVFGGSYGWSSACRFHHSQMRRFLNCLGGHVRHSESYSLGTANS